MTLPPTTQQIPRPRALVRTGTDARNRVRSALALLFFGGALVAIAGVQIERTRRGNHFLKRD